MDDICWSELMSVPCCSAIKCLSSFLLPFLVSNPPEHSSQRSLVGIFHIGFGQSFILCNICFIFLFDFTCNDHVIIINIFAFSYVCWSGSQFWLIFCCLQPVTALCTQTHFLRPLESLKGFHNFLFHLLTTTLVTGAGNLFLPCHLPILSGHHLGPFFKCYDDDQFSNAFNMHVSVCGMFALPWSWIYRLDLSLIESITNLAPVTGPFFSQFL